MSRQRKTMTPLVSEKSVKVCERMAVITPPVSVRVMPPAFLRGTPAADLPVEQSDTWKLIVNQSTAARMGLAIPSTILARADEVIE